MLVRDPNCARREWHCLMPRQAVIRAIRSSLPAARLTNEALAQEFGDWGVEKIRQKTGIAERGLAGPDECASDLGLAAARRLFEEGVCHPDEIDFLLFCTQSPDYFLPTTACLMQTKLGLRTDCGALDYNLGCSGYVYGLALAKGLIETGQAHSVLLVVAETYSKYIRPEDRSVRTIFGDGAAATLISAMERPLEHIGPFVFGTDGTGARHLMVEVGGHRCRVGGQGSAADPEASPFLHMDGPEIFNFTLESVPVVVEQLLAKSGLSMDEVALFVFHQANRFMLEALRRKIRIPAERFLINLESYGNTVSATIPMALELALREGQVAAGAPVLLVGFGVGYSWAGTIVRFI